MTATFPCATAQPNWLTIQAIDHYRASVDPHKSAAARTAHRKKFFTFAKQVLPVIGGAAFLEAFRQNLNPIDKEGVPVVEELIREMAAGN